MNPLGELYDLLRFSPNTVALYANPEDEAPLRRLQAQGLITALYHDPIPQDSLPATLEAFRNADTCLLIGNPTSHLLAREAYACGARLILFSDTPTPLDTLALLQFGSPSATLTQLADL